MKKETRERLNLTQASSTLVDALLKHLDTKVKDNLGLNDSKILDNFRRELTYRFSSLFKEKGYSVDQVKSLTGSEVATILNPEIMKIAEDNQKLFKRRGVPLWDYIGLGSDSYLSDIDDHLIDRDI